MFFKEAFLQLTTGQAVKANVDGSGSHWDTAGQALQHRLNRVALGLHTFKDHLLLQLHRFLLDGTLWKSVEGEGKYCMCALFDAKYSLFVL